MSKSEEKMLIWGGAVVGGILLISWLQSRPNCNAGCKTQLQHIKDHLLQDLFRVALAQLGV